MTTFQSFILGTVQGITEFLPISSSAHLILVPWFLGWNEPGLAFDVFLHLGTLFALVVYFFRDWWELLKAGISSIIERRIGFDRKRVLFWCIVVGTIPAGLAGFFFADLVEAYWRAPLLTAMSLSVVGFLLYFLDQTYPTLRGLNEVSFKESFWIGVAQALSIIPGVSRSGSTIAMARLLGFNREASARYSFLLSVPIVFAAGVFKCKDLPAQMGTLSFTSSHLIVGFLSSAIFGFASIYVLLRFVATGHYGIFAMYRIVLAGFVVLWSAVFNV